MHGVVNVDCAGAGVFARFSREAWFRRVWGHLDLLPQEVDGVRETCRLFCSMPWPLQSVRRIETWGVKLAMQVVAAAVHVGGRQPQSSSACGSTS